MCTWLWYAYPQTFGVYHGSVESMVCTSAWKPDVIGITPYAHRMFRRNSALIGCFADEDVWLTIDTFNCFGFG